LCYRIRFRFQSGNVPTGASISDEEDRIWRMERIGPMKTNNKKRFQILIGHCLSA